jgi:hypothetical protein
MEKQISRRENKRLWSENGILKFKVARIAPHVDRDSG